MQTTILSRDVRHPSRALALLAVSALALGLTGCGRSKGDPAVPPGSGGGDQDLVLMAVHPSGGPPTGGTLVELTGSGFAGCEPEGFLVRFGGQPASEVVVLSDSTLLATTPAGTPGMVVSVSVLAPCGEAMLNDAFTYSLAGPPISDLDLDGDGLADFTIGAPGSELGGEGAGAVFVFLGTPIPVPVNKFAADADIVIIGGQAGDRLGESLLTADLDGDGIADLLVGAPGASYAGEDAGAVYIFFGPFTGGETLTVASASITIPGPEAGARFGAALAVGSIASADALGQRDLLVGAPGASAAYHFQEASGLEPWQGTAGAAVVIDGIAVEDRLGATVALADITGDGIDELVLGAPDAGLDGGGAVYALRVGPALVSSSAATADATWLGAPGEGLGSALAFADLDGDGILDLVAGAPTSSAVASEAGRAYLFLGSEELAGGTTADALATYSGLLEDGRFGTALATGDIDGDGYHELAVGAPRESTGSGSQNGRVYIFRGGPDAPVDRVASSAEGILAGQEATGGEFGSTLGCADFDADGRPQLIVGAPSNSTAGVDAGRAYVFRDAASLVPNLSADDVMLITGAAPGDRFGSSVTR